VGISCWPLRLTRGTQEVLQFDMRQKWHTVSKSFTLFFNIIALNSNMYVTSAKNFFAASQIEFWPHAVQIRLSTQWPVWSHCHHGTTSSDGEIGRSHWVPDLVSKVGVTTIPIPCPLLQPAEQSNSLWVIPGKHATRILFDWHQRAFW